MKMLILSMALVPFYNKRIYFEVLTICSILCFSMMWHSWETPTVYSVGLMSDKLSAILMMLSLWMAVLMTLVKSKDMFLSLNTTLLLLSLLGFFLVSSFLPFFVLFETSLIPTLMLILGWGYQPERLEASYYFIFYTITLSIPLLCSLVWLTTISGKKYFYFDHDLYEVCSSILGLTLLCVFLIKLPMFMVHFWLPKAHVEAPVVGSMILAGVLLKTGGYGIVRIFTYMNKTLLCSAVMAISLIGMVLVCLVCLYCTDLKQMIAFSSVSHMNFMIVGLMNNSQLPYGGSVMMMVSHGLCSSLMFMLADMSYNRCGSRSILVNKGLLMLVPTLSMLWALTVLFNMGVPPSVGSISEIVIISSSSETYMIKASFALYLFLSAFYSTYLYMSVNHGSSQMTCYSLQVKESFAAAAHLVPLSGLTLVVKMLILD